MNGGKNINNILLELAEPLIQEREKNAEIRGIQKGIIGTVDVLRSLGHSDEEIKTIISDKYNLSQEDTEKYLYQ